MFISVETASRKIVGHQEIPEDRCLLPHSDDGSTFITEIELGKQTVIAAFMHEHDCFYNEDGTISLG